MTENLGSLGDAIYSKAQEIAQFSGRLKQMEDEKKALEERLLQAMQDAGTDIVRGDKATVSISTSVKAQILDFDKLSQFIFRNKDALSLFERRIASKAYSELKESRGGKAIPGLQDFVHQRLNVRKVG